MRSSRKLERIEPRIANFVADQEFYVLRDSLTNKALNVSYTEDGLKWTTNATGKLIYFRNAKVQVNYDKNYLPVSTQFVGDTRPSNKVKVEKFIPTNHAFAKAQIAEYTWVDKAYRLAIQNAAAF